MARTQYRITKREEEMQEYFLSILKTIAILHVIVTTIVLICGDLRLQKLEEICPTTMVVLPQRTTVKEQVRLYIQSLEVPLEDTYEEEPEKVQEQVQEQEKVQEQVQEVTVVPVAISGGSNYNPTAEERQWAYRIAKSEAGIEDAFGKTLVINVAINNMRASGHSNLIEEFTYSGRYSSVVNGVPCIMGNDGLIPVTDDMLTDELKNAVDLAFEHDYTEELLKQVAEAKGLDASYYEDGARYFYNPDAISEYQASLRADIKVRFKYGRHIFYKVW